MTTLVLNRSKMLRLFGAFTISLAFSHHGRLDCTRAEDSSLQSLTFNSVTAKDQNDGLFIEGRGIISSNELSFLEGRNNEKRLHFQSCIFERNALECLHFHQSLEEIAFYGCSIRDSHLRSIAHCERLKSVTIVGGYISVDGLMSLHRLPTIEKIGISSVATISDRHSIDKIKASFGDKVSLQSPIHPAGERVPDKGVRIAGCMVVVRDNGEGLRIMNDANEFNAFVPVPAHINTRVLLKYVEANDCKLIHFDRVPLWDDEHIDFRHSSVKSLILSNTGADDSAVDALIGKTHISSLVIEGEPITVNVASTLVSLRSLREVIIRDCMYAAGIERSVKQVRPDITVHYEYSAPNY